MTTTFETDVFQDMTDIHDRFGVHEWVRNNPEKLKQFLEFRVSMIQEEVDETRDAIAVGDPEEIVDGLIDILVFAIGTLDLFDVDGEKAWKAVHNANMAKEPGVKEGRYNPMNLPDMLKPKDWQAPSHEGNHGILPRVFK